MRKSVRGVRLVSLGMIMILFVSGCLGQALPPESAAPDLLEASWDEIAQQAQGSTVRMYMWGGSDSVNRYIDEWVAPRLKEEADVTLKRIPVNDTQDILNKLIAEKQAGKQEGSADIFWINGENFKTAKDQELIWGAFAGKLPHVEQYVDQEAPDIQFDFGEAVNDLEAPWGKAQFVFIYDEEKVKNPPKSMDELMEWARQNPGKFTYPAPPDFNGSAFVRHVLFETAGGSELYQQEMTAEELEKRAAPAWEYLNKLKPYLWREGNTYPESAAKLDQLYANGEVWMSMGYDSAHAANQVRSGYFPPSTHTFVLEQGTLANTHYLSIPFNAPNPAGAMVAINFMLAPEAQIAKYDPEYWGDDLAIDPDRLSAEEREQLAQIDRGEATLAADQLADHQLPELNAAAVETLEKGWMQHVAKE